MSSGLLARNRVSLYQLNNLFISLIAFILLILVTSTFHINYLSDRIIDISLVQNIVLFFLLLNHEKYEPGVLKKSIYAFAFGSSLLGVFYIYGIGVEYTGGRLSLFEDNENAIGIRMAISSIYLINSFFALSKKFYFKKSLIVLPVPLLIIVMMGTSSRVAFISFCVMLLALLGFYFLIHPIKRLVPIVMISGLVAYFFIPFILSNDLLINRLLASKSGDLAGRGDIWLSYIPSIWKSPIFGYGFSGYEKISMNIFGQLVSPHNVIIEVLLYSGFAGFALLMCFICMGQQVIIYHGQNKSHVVPYVVNVDDLGRAKVITEIQEAPINDERVIRAFVYQYIDRVWSVASDPGVIKRNLENAYKDSTESVQKNFLDSFQQEDNPLDYMKSKGTKYIEPTVFLRQSENTYSVEWREIDRNYDNQVLGETRYKGLFSVVQVPHTNKDNFEDNPDNPFGLYVTSVSWAKLN